jgi:Domain of unknown function (DUF4190)
MTDQSGYPGNQPPPGTPPPAWQAGPPPGPGGYGYAGQAAPKTDGLAIAGFVMAIVGLLFFGIVLGPAGLILGIVSFRRINREPGRYKGRGLAIAAMIIGAITTVLAILLIVAIANDPSIID